MDNKIPAGVQMQFLRPGQLEKRGREFPVVYVPFGLIEWHGKHLPLGNDALKAHAILTKCAEMYGGVVYPPQFLHCEFENTVSVYSQLFEKLKQTGYRVIIAISGHDIQEQVDMMSAALAPVTADGTVRGYAGLEHSLSKCADSDADHAAKWETSNMMFFYPDLVDMDTLGPEPINLKMEPPDGIGGLDPREHASAAVGERNCFLSADSIGKKAAELLNSLPPEQRGFNIEKIVPGKWWQL
ncbi:MAG: creatininase family protein [Oscillospiraceae bacterium]|nr:creatininase family protein [Oscillospiraceae bacterium]